MEFDSAVRVYNWARSVSVSAIALALLCMLGAPARADDNGVARAHESKQRATSALTLSAPGSSARTSAGVMNGFIYTPGPQPIVGFHGRVNVGKSGVYVPYYGNVSNDPSRPSVQGVAGIGYGFRQWDISVVNGGFGTTAPSAIPGGDAPKANPSLSLSIRF